MLRAKAELSKTHPHSLTPIKTSDGTKTWVAFGKKQLEKVSARTVVKKKLKKKRINTCRVWLRDSRRIRSNRRALYRGTKLKGEIRGGVTRRVRLHGKPGLPELGLVEGDKERTVRETQRAMKLGCERQKDPAWHLGGR